MDEQENAPTKRRQAIRGVVHVVDQPLVDRIEAWQTRKGYATRTAAARVLLNRILDIEEGQNERR